MKKRKRKQKEQNQMIPQNPVTITICAKGSRGQSNVSFITEGSISFVTS